MPDNTLFTLHCDAAGVARIEIGHAFTDADAGLLVAAERATRAALAETDAR